MVKEKALLLDVTYFDEGESSIIHLFVLKEREHYWLRDANYRPYFFIVVGESEKNKVIDFLRGAVFGVEEKFSLWGVEEANKKLGFGEEDASGGGESVIKISFKKVSHLIAAKKIFYELGYARREYDIPYAKRYLLDKLLEPGNFVEYEFDETISEGKNKIEGNEKFVSKEKKIIKLKSVSASEGDFFGVGTAFDLETYSTDKFGIGIEPIIMSSIVRSELGGERGKLGEEKIELKEKPTQLVERVISYDTQKVSGLELVENEEELIRETIIELNKKENSFIVTYNGDNFDFAYLRERAKKNGVEFLVNYSQPRTIRAGRDNAVKLLGIQHIDSYQIIRFLSRTGAINTVKMDLETVSEKVFGEPKEKIFPNEINEAWESGDEQKLLKLVDYNIKDSRTALKIAKEFLPLFIELSKLTSQTLYETTRNTSSQMIEDLLLKEVNLRGVIAPNKPRENEINQRMNNPIKGGFVKEPIAGLHENIAVLDFASLYPSIIITHNLSPETLNCGHAECKTKNSINDNTHFCTKTKGLFPQILKKMLTQRLALKKEYNKKKKEGVNDKILFAKQWALKIILNSAYGYLAYPRARWYSRETASATTALAREYIKRTSRKAEESGFRVLYNDTDSAFLQFGEGKGESEKRNVGVGDNKRVGGKKEVGIKKEVGSKNGVGEVKKFIEEINASLPEGMELELDGFYKRGIFVTKKEGGAAKKRYALIDEKDNLKIVGFEYVRRDWCNIAKETQKKVIELVLKEGNPQKAVEFVKQVIDEIKSYKTPKKELVIMTLLQRKISDYSSIGPHVAAAQKGVERGKKIGVGSILSFVITKGNPKMSISDKAELEEFVGEGNYDVDYYIENQVLPAVIKIMQELGYGKEDLLTGGKQTGLGGWC